MANRLPFPLWAVFLGAFGMLVLVAGLLGVLGEPPIAVLAEPAVGWSLVGIGALLVLAETIVIAVSLVNRR